MGTPNHNTDLHILLTDEVISKNIYNHIKKKSITDKEIIPVLVNQYGVCPKKISLSLSKNLNIPTSELSTLDLSNIDIENFSIEFMAENNAIAITKNKCTHMICCSIYDILNIQNSTFTPNQQIKFYISSFKETTHTLNHLLSKTIYSSTKIIGQLTGKLTNNNKLNNIINFILSDATIKNASDIHIEPTSSHIIIRYRIDGILTKILKLPINASLPIVNKLKIMSNLDISEKRIPQDGRFNFKTIYHHNRDCRINCCPSIHGEKIVLRILNPNQKALSINQLNLNKKYNDMLIRSIKQPQGLILITGPTGSGKTNTLYTLLNIINTEKINIITVENPVELTLNGLHQINISNKIKFGFTDALRACLRQDPDVIMIGEIRDKESAEIAIHAAQTGHLVLSTIHANCTIDTITRLINMSIRPFNLINSLSLVVAQRLVRKLCNNCKIPGLSTTEKELLSNIEIGDKIFHSSEAGCDQCTHGYYGRAPVFEFLKINDEVKSILSKESFASGLESFFIESNINKLKHSAFFTADQGLTSISEIYRSVLY